MAHKGPYTVTLITKRDRTHTHVRKTFKAAEGLMDGSFILRESLVYANVSNAEGTVFSRFNFDNRAAE